jgi:hypothetical protein
VFGNHAADCAWQDVPVLVDDSLRPLTLVHPSRLHEPYVVANVWNLRRMERVNATVVLRHGL